jgi:polygalacturonase
MGMNRVSLSVLTSVAASFACIFTVKADGEFNVRNYGATGNGTTPDTVAIQKALDACAAAGGGSVVVPAGDYLIGSVNIGSSTTLRMENRASFIGSPNISDYPVESVRFEGEFVPGHRALLSAKNASNITIAGRGFIYGPPLGVSRLREPRGPVLIEFTDCTNVMLDGFTTQYQRLWSIHPLFCRNVTARNLTIRSVGLNGDGIDVDSCDDVLIERCDINTGDDAISLKSGRGQSAIRNGQPTDNVTIRDCTLVSTIYAALGIGSELSGGIRNVHLENCTLSGFQNGIFFKSREGRGGFIENFTGENLTVHNSPTFLHVALLDTGIQATDPVTGNPDQWTQITNVHFTNVRVENISRLLLAQEIPVDRPVNGFSLNGVRGTCGYALNMSNMTNVVLSSICLTNYQGPFLTQSHVHGTGLSDSD